MKKTLLLCLVLSLILVLPTTVRAVEQNGLPPSKERPTGIVGTTQVGDSPCILVYADGWGFEPPNTVADQALKSLGLSYRACYSGNFSGFTAELLRMNPCCVIYDSQGIGSTSIAMYDALNNYVLAGGKLIICNWAMHLAPPHPLWATLGVNQSASYDIRNYTRLYQWDLTNAVFSNLNAIPNPLVQNPIDLYGIHAVATTVIGGAFAIGGNQSSPAVGRAYMVLHNEGRTLLNNFLLDEVTGDINGNGRPDAIDLMENEIAYVCLGKRESVVGGEILPSELSSTLLPTMILSPILVAVASVLLLRKRTRT